MQGALPLIQEYKKQKALDRTLGDVLGIQQESAMPHHLKPYWNTPMRSLQQLQDYTGQGLASLLRDPYAGPQYQTVTDAWYDSSTGRFGMGSDNMPKTAKPVNVPGSKFFPMLQKQKGQDIQSRALDMRGRLTKLQEARGANADDLNTVRAFNAVLQPILSVYSDQLDETSLEHINKALDEMEPAMLGLAKKYKMKFEEPSGIFQPAPKKQAFTPTGKQFSIDKNQIITFGQSNRQPKTVANPADAKAGDFYRNKAGILMKAVPNGKLMGWQAVTE
jgi:hypothetical protein